VPAFFHYVEHSADTANTWIFRTIGEHPNVDPESIAIGAVAISSTATFAFLFLTPAGWLTMYLIASGAIRAVSAGVTDDPRGDFVITGIDWILHTTRERASSLRRRAEREKREGVETPDVLATGEWAGLNADYVVIASRQKPEWTAGAIVMTGTDWYRLGDPLETELPEGLRMLYPLTKLDAAEVLRRGIVYELPRLTRRARPSKP
jgi:hypothetical protein